VNDEVIRLEGISKTYGQGDAAVHAVVDVSFGVNRGDLVAVMGPSGSGKSTLMNILGCLDVPTSGRYRFAGEDVSRMSESELARIRDRRGSALHALEQVGLAHRVDHRPTELSGGQQQRVAIARALVTDPDLILADEPTGNLDSASSREVLAILEELNRDGRTVIVITHEAEVAAMARRTLTMSDGRLREEAAA